MPDSRIALVPVEGAAERIAQALYRIPYSALSERGKEDVQRIITALGLDREDWPTRRDLARVLEGNGHYIARLDDLDASRSADVHREAHDRIEKALG